MALGQADAAAGTFSQSLKYPDIGPSHFVVAEGDVEIPTEAPRPDTECGAVGAVLWDGGGG